MATKTPENGIGEDTIIELTNFFDAHLLSTGKTSLTLRTANDLIKWEEKFEKINLKELLEGGYFPQAYQTDSKPKQWYINFSKPDKFTKLKDEALKETQPEEILTKEVKYKSIPEPSQKLTIWHYVVGIVILLVIFKACEDSDNNNNSKQHDNSRNEEYSREDNSNNTDAKKPEEMREEAAFTAQEFMRNHLKSPASAEFPSFNYSKFYASNDTYSFIIKSYVDAQNSYGALIRTYYLVQMKWNGKDWLDINNWTLIDLETDVTEF